MIKTKTHTNLHISIKEIQDFISQKIKDDKARDDNRKAIMAKQLLKVTKGKNIVISNFK